MNGCQHGGLPPRADCGRAGQGSVHVGLHGWRRKASRKRWRKTVLPPVVLISIARSVIKDGLPL